MAEIEKKGPGDRSLTPVFNRAAAPPEPVEAPKPEPKPRPPEQAPAGPSPAGPGMAQGPPPVRGPTAEQDAKKEGFKKEMLSRQFNEKAREHEHDHGR